MGIYYADGLGNQAALIKMIHDDVNSVFSPDQSVSNFRSSARLLHGCRRKSRLRRSTLRRPVHQSSFWTSKEVYETFQSRRRKWMRIKPTGSRIQSPGRPTV